MCELFGTSSSLEVGLTRERQPVGGLAHPFTRELGGQRHVFAHHVAGTDPDTVIAAVASAPRMADPWEPLAEGTVLALSRGREIARAGR